MPSSADENLKIVIEAIDNASATLKKIAENTEGATNKVSSASKKAGVSFGTLVGGSVSANAAYDALTKTYEAVKSFFEGSIQEAMESSKTMAQVKVDVENAGLSYSAISSQIEEVSRANEQLGFSNDETSKSIGKLILASGDYSMAFKLNSLAMDLARAKGVDLATATSLVQQVMMGNTRVMKQYGITLDETTTSGEALNLLQDKLKGSAEAYASTAAGELDKMKSQWQDIQEQVGNELMPIAESMFDFFEDNLPEITKAATIMAEVFVDIVQVFKDLWKFGENVVKVLDDMRKSYEKLNPVAKVQSEILNRIGEWIGKNVKGLHEYLQAEAELDEITEDARKSSEALMTQEMKAVNAYNKVHFAQISIFDVTAKTKKSYDLLSEASKNLRDQTTKVSGNFSQMPNYIGRADNAVVKHAEAIEKLVSYYNKMKSSASVSLAEMSDQFTEKMKSIRESVDGTIRSIEELKESYASQQNEEVAKVADTIIESEKKIADMKKQIADVETGKNKSMTWEDVQILQAQLKAEEENYKKTIEFRDQYSDAISDARKKASGDLQYTLDQFKATQEAEKKTYEKKLELLRQELIDKAQEIIAEQALYKSKTEQINLILDEANVYFAKLSADRLDTTTDEVQKEIELFQDLAAAISQTKSASQSAVSQISIPQIPGLPAHEFGGIVDAPRGTAVPIMAHGQEEIIPAEQVRSRSGTTINVTITNPVVRKNSDLEEMKKMFESVMRPILINAKIAHT